MLLLKWDVLDDTEVPVTTFILDNSQVIATAQQPMIKYVL